MDAITNALMGLFKWINDTITSNFGLTIVLFTLLLRLVCLPLDIRARKGQRDFQRKTAMIQPEMDKLNKAYKNDPQQLQRKVMELRKSVGLGLMPKGCFSQLLVYPLLIAFFAVFRSMAAQQTEALAGLINTYGADSAEVTKWFAENSFLWIHNLWMPDNLAWLNYVPVLRAIPLIGGLFNNIVADIVPIDIIGTNTKYLSGMFSDAAKVESFQAAFTALKALPQYAGANGLFVLPVLAGAVQFFSLRINQKLNPTPTPNSDDPQAASGQKMSKFMNIFFPILFVYFCLTSSSALAIYWITSSLIMLATNVIINKVLDAIEKKKAAQAA